MRDFKKTSFQRLALQAAALTLSATCTSAFAQAAHTYGLGTLATEAQIAGWSMNVYSDGRNLPKGSGMVMAGQEIYNMQCAACHGAKGEGGLGGRLSGGMSSLATDKPILTVGSYWPYASTLYDYVRRAMTQNAPQSLSNDEVYSVTGYVLFLNDLVKKDAKIQASTLADLKMPNRDGFVPDPRPDVK